MNKRPCLRWPGVAALAGLGAAWASAQPAPIRSSHNDGDNGVEVLTRGPVHEAFAEPITFDPDPGLIVTGAPPAPIEEVPPDQRPDGVNVDWIPGYWAWDDERNEFLWISGVWRALPPGREWVPGYWGGDNRGHQWTAGYWADAQASEVEYLPEPPLTVEVGPNIVAPSPDHSWMPGSWVWYEGRYAWRPGYWLVVQADWDWIPAHYVWAPRGYVFVDGYWDHPLGRRGVLYAPIRFEPAVYARVGFSYSPVTIINTTVFSDHLFVRPHYNHYYFGDYYAASYRDSGFFASFSFQSGRRGYDPIYTRERWRHRQNPQWEREVQVNFERRRDHEDDRPRRTFAAQIAYTSSDKRRDDRSLRVASTVEQAARGDNDGPRFKRVDADVRQRETTRAKDVQRFREDRRRDETEAAVERAPNRAEPVRIKARRSPIAAPAAQQLNRKDGPPARPDAPRPDPRVERKPRKSGEKRERPDKP